MQQFFGSDGRQRYEKGFFDNIIFCRIVAIKVDIIFNIHIEILTLNQWYLCQFIWRYVHHRHDKRVDFKCFILLFLVLFNNIAILSIVKTACKYTCTSNIDSKGLGNGWNCGGFSPKWIMTTLYSDPSLDHCTWPYKQYPIYLSQFPVLVAILTSL